MINLTQSAIDRLKELLLDEPEGTRFRVFVQGGGCSGFQYGFTFEEAKEEDDFEVVFDGTSVLVDHISLQYLAGATVDFEEGPMGTFFRIDNPAAVSTCGCGASFSM